MTQLSDGSSYLVAGSNITISSASNGAITVAATGGGSIDGSGAATRLAYWTDSDTLTSDADLTFDDTTLTVNKSAIFNEEGGSNDFRYINSLIRVAGTTTGQTLDIPVRFIRQVD